MSGQNLRCLTVCHRVEAQLALLASWAQRGHEYALAALKSVIPDLRALVSVGNYDAPGDEDDVWAGNSSCTCQRNRRRIGDGP
jgi:hypothetical protein